MNETSSAQSNRVVTTREKMTEQIFNRKREARARKFGQLLPFFKNFRVKLPQKCDFQTFRDFSKFPPVFLSETFLPKVLEKFYKGRGSSTGVQLIRTLVLGCNQAGGLT